MKKVPQYKPVQQSTGGLEIRPGSFNGRANIDRMYDFKWEKYRERFLLVNFYCYSCGARATIVDHLIPHQGDEKLFKKLDNHIPLCKKCHDYITAKFDRYFRKGSPIIPKLTWIANNRKLNGVTFKVIVLGHY